MYQQRLKDLIGYPIGSPGDGSYLRSLATSLGMMVYDGVWSFGVWSGVYFDPENVPGGVCGLEGVHQPVDLQVPEISAIWS